MHTERIRVEVAYALPERQSLIVLEVEPGCTVYAAAERSGIAREYSGLDIAQAEFGVFGRLVRDPRREVLRDGDRVEIYRPLLIDPKETRRQRANRQA